LETANNSATYGYKSYQYDEIGNIIEKDGKTYSYGEGGAGVHAVTTTDDGTTRATYTYDENGNMATKQIQGGEFTEFTYDTENRLINIVKDGATIADYEYDGDGGRVKKDTDNGITRFVGSLYEETGATTRSHVFLGSTRIATIADGAIKYSLKDHLGGSNVVTDDTGAIEELIEYQPFGKKARHENYVGGASSASHYFAAYYEDEESGLMYLQARYYDPELGRFITPDTIVQDPSSSQTFNRYSYCGNNPIMRTDPSGHIFGLIAWAISQVVSYAIAHAGAIAIGAAIGGIGAAATGGNIGMGMLTGAIGGAIFGGIGSLGYSGLAQVGAHAAGGALSGGINAAITGGDVVQGMLVGGIAAGVTQGLGQKFSFLSAKTQSFKQFAGAFVGRSVIGAVIGGGAAVATGGKFAEGAKNGAITSGISFLANDASHGKGYLRNKIGGFIKSAGSATKTLAVKAKSALSVVLNSDQKHASRASRLIAGAGTAIWGGSIAAGAATIGPAVGGSILLMGGMLSAIDAGIDLSGNQDLGPDQAAFESFGMPGGKLVDAALDTYGAVAGSFANIWKGIDRAANTYNLINDLK